MERFIGDILLSLHKFTYPVLPILKRAYGGSILDVGCGNGEPARILQLRQRFSLSVGVDIFLPSLQVAKSKRSHHEFVLADARFLPFRKSSFNVVISLQLIEHLEKNEAIAFISSVEEISRKLIIITTPIGYMKHEIPENPYQLHKCGFIPEDFRYRGYKCNKVGLKCLFGEEGVVHRRPHSLLRKAIFTFEPVLNVFFNIIPTGNYYFIAYKNKA